MNQTLTNDNYYEDTEYMSASQFKDFLKCEAYGLAKYKKEWIDETSPAFLIGGYVDAYFSDELERYRFDHPELFNKDGSLKATYKIAEVVIDRIKQDEYMMQLLSGVTQLIQTGTISGVPFKIKMDSVLEDTIVDQKIMKDEIILSCNLTVEHIGEGGNQEYKRRNDESPDLDLAHKKK